MIHRYRVGLLGAMLLASAVAVPGRAQEGRWLGATAPIRFERAEMEPYLPQSSVYAVIEDLEGYLWFATREGVGRWDGYEMRTWKHDPFDAASLPGNVVRALMQDRYGNVWLAAQDYLQRDIGVARIVAPAHHTVQRYGFAGARPFLDETGHPLLVSPDSLYRYAPARDRFEALLPRAQPGLPANTAYASRDGLIWISSGGNQLESCDRTRRICHLIPWENDWRSEEDVGVTSGLFEDDRGTVWIGTSDGLAHLNASRTQVAWVPTSPARLKGHYVADFEQDVEGFLWAVTSDGVYRFDPDAQQFDRYLLLTLGEDTQNLAPVGLHIDRAGSIWVGTVWGLYRYNRHRKPFGHFQHNPQQPNTLSAGLVVSLLEDKDGNLWVGTIGGGLNRVNRRTGAVTRYRHDPNDLHALSHDIVWSLGTDQQGRVWAGTNFGLNRYDPAIDGFRVHYLDPTMPRSTPPVNQLKNSVAGFATDQQGLFWIFTSEHKLVRFDPTRGTFEHLSMAASLVMGYMKIFDAQTLWFDSGEGVSKMNLQTLEITPLLGFGGETNYDGILVFHRDQQAVLWVGANSGLYRLGPDGSVVTRYSDADGLPSSVVYGILEDDAGRLWLSTNRGLAVLDPNLPPGQQVRSFDHTSGIQNTEFNRGAFLKARDGTLFFGGDKGVTFFHPDDIHTNPYRPPVVLTALHRSTQQGTTTTRYLGDGPVSIAPPDYTFSFEFAALNFTNAHRNQYEAMLEGFDTDWIELGTRRTSTYTNVPPGTYTFRVKASNDDGLWNEEGTAIKVVVAPWFWQTWWFLLLISLSLVGLIAAGVWYVSRNRYRQQLQAFQAQQALEEERNRISRDMHDEVGASLTEIAILSELAQRQRGNGLGAQSHLEKIASTSRDMLDSIGEIIWAINPQNDRLDRVVAYFREYAAAYLENTPAQSHLRFPQRVPEASVSAAFRRNVFLVMKEALHNLVKHAKASTVEVELILDAVHLVLCIEDDGCGFTCEAGRLRGNGLRNMKHRAEAINGTLAVDARQGRGTRIHLSVPLASHITQPCD